MPTKPRFKVFGTERGVGVGVCWRVGGGGGGGECFTVGLAYLSLNNFGA